ncbi:MULTISPECIES: PDGLE domain-containing protein [Mumia]|uniref:PDGLE domain-containing protein n=1 Tax=Mumia TaxID=1546255 RepID=UPI001AB044A8|nr:PDGLE domain-containing protein [Mumia sp. ZJ430]
MRSHRKSVSTRAVVLVGLLIALVLAGFVSYYASSRPDGLEYVATDKGFDTAKEHKSSAGSPMEDYSTKGVDDPRLSGAVAGVTGTVLVLVIAGGVALVARRRGHHSA